MEQITALALLLAAAFAFLARAPRQFLRNLLHRRPAWIFAAPPLLTAVFTIAAALSGVSSPPLTLLVLAYTAAPVLCAYAQGAGPVSRPSALDFLTVLLLWLPLEFSAGASLIPRPAQGFLHGVAYGIAILLGLVLFVGFRSVTGLKYNLPHHAREDCNPDIPGDRVEVAVNKLIRLESARSEDLHRDSLAVGYADCPLLVACNHDFSRSAPRFSHSPKTELYLNLPD